MIKHIIHVSHTDIPHDSRILKELEVLNGEGYVLEAIGVAGDEGTKASRRDLKFKYKSLKLSSRGIKFLPSILRHTFVFLELFLKIIGYVVRARPCVVHCHDVVVLPIGVVAKLLTKCKLVYDAHELESDRNGLTGIQRKLIYACEKVLFKFVDGFITVSPSILEWYELNFGSKTISGVVMNSPVVDDKDSYDENYLRELYSIPNESVVFIYIGILAPGRGIELLLDAFKNISPDLHIVFLGYGDLKQSILHEAEKYKNIHYHQAVEHENVVRVARSADVGVCLIQNVSLSDYYCLPNKLFEYVFAGLRVLTSDFPELRRVVTEFDLGFCCELNEASIRKAILQFEVESKIFGVQRDNRRFYSLSWDRQSEILKGMYQKLVGEG